MRHPRPRLVPASETRMKGFATVAGIFSSAWRACLMSSPAPSRRTQSGKTTSASPRQADDSTAGLPGRRGSLRQGQAASCASLVEWPVLPGPPQGTCSHHDPALGRPASRVGYHRDWPGPEAGPQYQVGFVLHSHFQGTRLAGASQLTHLSNGMQDLPLTVTLQSLQC